MLIFCKICNVGSFEIFKQKGSFSTFIGFKKKKKTFTCYKNQEKNVSSISTPFELNLSALHQLPPSSPFHNYELNVGLNETIITSPLLHFFQAFSKFFLILNSQFFRLSFMISTKYLVSYVKHHADKQVQKFVRWKNCF